MTVGSGQRQYRACQRCRRRKSRCDLSSIGEVGKPPCLECFRTGQDCTLAPSRRGGDYSQYRKSRRTEPTRSKKSVPSSDSPSAGAESPTLTSLPRRGISVTDNEPEDDPIDEELRNPSDALQILTRSTDPRNGSEEVDSPSVTGSVVRSARGPMMDDGRNNGQTTGQSLRQQTMAGLKDYAIVAKGFLLPVEVQAMVQTYATNYHPFMPVVPDFALAPQNIDRVAREEAFLLTIILTIASKDDFELSAVHHHCCQHTKRLLLDVLLALPPTFGVGTVEGLLVLSEWLPYISFTFSPSMESARGSFPEDSTAWSLIGQAIRHAYMLRLDRMSFYDGLSEEEKKHALRERLAWTFVYLADRQISVRMGQSFWSRGSSLSTKFTTKDFSLLRPRGGDDHDDYASIHLATMELTQLLHNVHDIMYSSRQRTLSMIFTGDYNRYLDDFHKGLLLWHATWDGLEISTRLKSTLTLMCQYLSLYANSFSFQAVITRSSRSHNASTHPRRRPTKRDLFPGGVMASPDGRYIHDALRSAKMLLQTFNAIDPDLHLRYMPCRYYLYGIYAAVFLFKAEAFGALSSEKESHEVFRLIKDCVTAMSKAAAGEHHVGWRYSKLLMALCSNNQKSKDQGCGHGTDPGNLDTPEERPLIAGGGSRRFSGSNMVAGSMQSSTNLDKISPNAAGAEDRPFLRHSNSPVPFQLSDLNFPTPDATWMNMSFDSGQNFFTMESPFALHDMLGVPQFDEGMQIY